MSSLLDRAQLLYHQSRYELAEQEVRRALGELPHDGLAHALLGLCLVRQDKIDEAQAEVEESIALAPDEAYPHYCRSFVLEHRRRFAEAEASARQAVALQPLLADYHARFAATLFRQGKWHYALEAASQGLSHDPEHEACGHLRSMALTKLGRQSEAIQTVDEQLTRAPDDAMAHTNKGWALMHQGKLREALEHFREALRIDPTFEYAQHGIVEALKARNPIYRWMLAYFLWMARLSKQAQWGVVVGGYVGIRLLQGVVRTNPEWGPYLFPLIAVYMGFALLTWFAVPLFNLLLRFNKFGWYALSPDMRRSANWFGICLSVFVVALVVYVCGGPPLAFLVAGYALGLALPLVKIYSCDVGWPRKMMTLFTGGMALLGAATIILAALDMEVAVTLMIAFLIGFVATPWLTNYLVGVTPRR